MTKIVEKIERRVLVDELVDALKESAREWSAKQAALHWRDKDGWTVTVKVERPVLTEE